MVNHARTYLLNRNPTQDLILGVGGEFISRDFRKVSLDQELEDIYSQIIPPNAGNMHLNYALNQLMRLAHHQKLEDLVFYRDKRVTYLPFKDVFFEKLKEPIIIENLAGPATNFCDVVKFQTADTAEILTRLNIILLLEPGQQVRIMQFDETGKEIRADLINYAVSNSYSEFINIPGTNLKVYFLESPGSAWRISVFNFPVISATDRLLRVNLNENTTRLIKKIKEPYLQQAISNKFKLADTWAEKAGLFLLSLSFAIEDSKVN